MVHYQHLGLHFFVLQDKSDFYPEDAGDFYPEEDGGIRNYFCL
jgi:hypothetical protein